MFLLWISSKHAVLGIDGPGPMNWIEAEGTWIREKKDQTFPDFYLIVTFCK
jgi:hypothetical protein